MHTDMDFVSEALGKDAPSFGKGERDHTLFSPNTADQHQIFNIGQIITYSFGRLQRSLDVELPLEMEG